MTAQPPHYQFKVGRPVEQAFKLRTALRLPEDSAADMQPGCHPVQRLGLCGRR
jgi:hypothetical protein